MTSRHLQLACALCVTGLWLAPAANAADPMDSPVMAPQAPLHISSLQYPVPDLKMVRQDKQPVSLASEMNDGRPVVLNFIFTTCGAICPLMTQTFAEFQHQLGPDGARVHLMSISIDPEEDTPARLTDYARQFKAGRGWGFYTGTVAASEAAQKAFNVFGGDKMSHTPVTFMRAAPGAPWKRIDGFARPDDLIREYRSLQRGSDQVASAGQ